MTLNKETNYTADESNLQLKVVRDFEAPLATVWDAWTNSDVLDNWWAPHPWKAVTQSMDFKEGGSWFYFMEGPKGERHYSLANYIKIEARKSFSFRDSFTDENRKPLAGMPTQTWENSFSTIDGGTRVNVLINFPTIEDMNKTMETGFKEGFKMGHQNLDELLKKKK